MPELVPSVENIKARELDGMQAEIEVLKAKVKRLEERNAELMENQHGMQTTPSQRPRLSH